MKKKIATTIFTLATALGLAQEPLEPSLPSLPQLEAKSTPKKHFGYLRLGISDSQLPTKKEDFIPGFGLGYRLASGASAIDFSAAYNVRDIRTKEGKARTFFYTLPKANYLYYITPAKNNSFYAGGGLAWGGMRTRDAREFLGLMPNVALGYEMNRNAAWHSFIQLDVTQPAVAVTQKGEGLPGPLAELALGTGF